MSLRPSFSEFDLSKLLALFGCGKLSVIEEVYQSCIEPEFIREDDFALAKELLTKIIMGYYRDSPLDGETELFAGVVDCLAHYDQDTSASECLFWEAFMVDVVRGGIKASDEQKTLLRYLTEGRPLLGKQFRSNWGYYAYFTNTEVHPLFDLIRAQTKYQREFDYPEAENWMESVEAAGADVWYFAS